MDPYKRLQLAQVSNPSLRVLAAPDAPAVSLNVQSAPSNAAYLDGPVQVAAPQYLKLQNQDEAQAIAPADTSYAYSEAQQQANQGFLSKAKNFLLNTGEGSFARGIARVLPGGTNDLSANVEMSNQAADRAKNIATLLKQGKISAAQAQALIQSEVNTADQAVSNQKQIESELPTRTQIGLGAAQTAADLLSGGAYGSLSRGASLATDVGVNAALGAGQTAAAGGDAKQIGEGGLIGGATVGLFGGAAALISKIASRTNLPEEIVAHVVNSGDQTAAKAMADEAGLTEVEFRQLFKPGANEAVKQSGTAGKAVQDAFLQTGSKDSLDLAVTALSQTKNKGAVRDIVTNMLPDLKGNGLNRLVNDIVKADNPQDVAERLVQAQKLSPTVENPVESATIAPNETPSPATPQSSRPPDAVQSPVPTAAEGASPAVRAADTPVGAASGTDRVALPPDAESAAATVIGSLKAATQNYKEIAATRTVEKAKRVASGADAYEAAGGGISGVKAKLASLKGDYESKQMPPVDIPNEIKTQLHDAIEGSNLRPFEKLNTQSALAKLTGDLEGHLRPSEIGYLKRAFGEDFAAVAKEAADAVPQTALQTGKHIFDEVTGLPRALMSTLDFSFGGRQGLILGSRYPKTWASANRDSVRYAFDKGFFDRSMQGIEASPEYTTITDQMKVALPGIQEEAKQLEHYAGAGYAERIPVYGKAVQGSDRAYNGGLTKLRFDVAKKIIDSYGGTDEFLKFFDGKDQAMRDLGEFINTASGRGGKAGGLLDKDRANILSNTLFSPRLWASRLQTLNPYYYYRLDPAARKLALQTGVAFATTAGSVLAIAANIPGVSVEWDPRSADFAKIKVGNTRYDILGGLQQNIRTAAQLITGEKIDSTTGELQTLGPDRGFGKPSRKDILVQAFENKENPLIALGTKLLEMKQDKNGGWTDKFGNSVNPAVEVGKLGVPLNVQGAYQSVQDTGSIPKGIYQSAPSVFGIGVQTYGKTPTKDKTTGGDLTSQVKAGTDAKTKTKADFQSGLSADEKTLVGQSATALKKLHDEGTISDDQYTSAVALKKAQDNVVNGVKVPDGVTSTDAQKFYKVYNAMTPDAQKKYLQTKSAYSTRLVADLNKQRPDGLPELPNNNQVTKLYADMEAANSKPDVTAIDKNNNIKKFYTSAAKVAYSTDVQKIYSEGGSVDVKGLLADSSISKSDLDKAIELDNSLYNAGITTSLKFSKTFRKTYEYDVPLGSKKAGTYDSSDGTGKPKKEPVVNAHLSDLLSKTKLSTTVPRFTTADRKKVTLALPRLPSTAAKPKIKVAL